MEEMTKGEEVIEVKKGKRKLLIGCCCGVLVLAAVLILAFNFAKLRNSIAKNTSEPDEYMYYVEENSISSIAKAAGSLYETMLWETVQIKDKAITASATIHLEDTALEAIRDLTQVDLESMKELEVSVSLINGMKEKLASAALLIAKEKLLSLDVSMTENALHVQVPELIEKALTFGAENTEDFSEAEEAAYELLAALPDGEWMEKFIEKYYLIMVEQMDEVSLSEETLEVEGVSQECTLIRAEIDEDCVRDMAEAVLDALREDEEVKQLLKELAKKADVLAELDELEDFEEFAEIDTQFYEALDELEEEIEDIEFEEEFEYCLWVDNKGTVVGRTFGYEEENDYNTNYLFSMLMARDGKEVGLKLSAEMTRSGYYEYESLRELSGTGTISGNKLDAELVYNYEYATDGYSEEAEPFELVIEDWNLADLEDGLLHGTFRICLQEDMEGIILEAKTNVKKNLWTVDLSLFEDDTKYGTVTLNFAKEKAGKVAIPAKEQQMICEGFEDLLEWLSSFSEEAMEERFEKCGVAEDVLDMVENIMEEIRGRIGFDY